jgi:ubiquinone/menaquinone biosynthesis C-methylase UbiE
MSFDALAPHYRWMELVLAGNKLQRCRTAFLSQAAHRQNVLIVGEGNGRFLLECRRKLEGARVTCVDASARMLALARRRLQQHGLGLERTEFVHADLLAWNPQVRTYDLVVTHFFLDCFTPEQLRAVIAALANAAAADATWLLADFQVPPHGWRRYRAGLIHRLMYGFFQVAARLPARSLTPPDPLLQALQFSLAAREVSDWGLLHSDRWERKPPGPHAPS